MKTKTIALLTAALICFGLAAFVFLMTGCGTPDKHIARRSTGVLQARHAELTQRIKDDELGVYFGPIRWISHAVEERGVTKENLAIEQELSKRGAQ